MVMLAAKGLSFGYPGGVLALDGLTLEIAAGERLAILGPNGSGKTTLLMQLNGSLRPQRGGVLLRNRPARYDRASLTEWRTTVGLVLQDPDDQLFAGTVYQDVSFGPLNLGLDETEVRARVERSLADLRIEHLADRPIHMLSLGQKRRVVIAGVLAMNPAVLLLDEPTAGLDPHGVIHLLAALRQLSEGGTTIVFATHDVDLALAWSDRVALFADGKVIACDRPDVALADAAALKRAHLRRPLLLELGTKARELGLIDADDALPRTVDQMMDVLRRVAGTDRSTSPIGHDHPHVRME
jgi:cobalt/nickel transport system ATP-binding protein